MKRNNYASGDGDKSAICTPYFVYGAPEYLDRTAALNYDWVALAQLKHSLLAPFASASLLHPFYNIYHNLA
jgi:hypothetical protein